MIGHDRRLFERFVDHLSRIIRVILAINQRLHQHVKQDWRGYRCAQLLKDHSRRVLLVQPFDRILVPDLRREIALILVQQD